MATRELFECVLPERGARRVDKCQKRQLTEQQILDSQAILFPDETTCKTACEKTSAKLLENFDAFKRYAEAKDNTTYRARILAHYFRPRTIQTLSGPVKLENKFRKLFPDPEYSYQVQDLALTLIKTNNADVLRVLLMLMTDEQRLALVTRVTQDFRDLLQDASQEIHDLLIGAYLEFQVFLGWNPKKYTPWLIYALKYSAAAGFTGYAKNINDFAIAAREAFEAQQSQKSSADVPSTDVSAPSVSEPAPDLKHEEGYTKPKEHKHEQLLTNGQPRYHRALPAVVEWKWPEILQDMTKRTAQELVSRTAQAYAAASAAASSSRRSNTTLEQPRASSSSSSSSSSAVPPRAAKRKVTNTNLTANARAPSKVAAKQESAADWGEDVTKLDPEWTASSNWGIDDFPPGLPESTLE